MVYDPQSQLGRGATISWTPTAGTLTAFASLLSITPPATSVGEVENLLLSSTFKGYLPTVPEGEGSFKVQHWDGDPGCVAMQAACHATPTPLGVFLITFPSGATLSVPGFPKKYAIGETSNEGIIEADVEYRQTAVATYTPPV